MTECIFVDRPKECIIYCMNSLKLKCLENHLHLKVRQEAKFELDRILQAEYNDGRRYKTKSGQEGRL